MKLTDREYRILLAECASRILPSFSWPMHSERPKQTVDTAQKILKECGIENEADSDPSLKMP